MTHTTHNLERWFAQHGWNPYPYQQETWQAYLDGRSGLVHAPTGVGKTLAVWGGPILEALQSRTSRTSHVGTQHATVLWITPLRTLANDTLENLRQPMTDLGLNWSVEIRTGDTSASARQKQQKRLPTALITTPESLSLLLSYPGRDARFGSLRAIVIDEWHELIGTKRGVQTELGLAQLRAICPEARIWGLSATLGNVDEAARVLLGRSVSNTDEPTIIAGELDKSIAIDTLLPGEIERYPWAGHLGITLLPDVIRALEGGGTTLLFTNTRSQTEIWFRALLTARPDWIGEIAVHHGSLDMRVRRDVESLLREGRLRGVVCTSSLDLGVDFTPVDQVIQIGSPKGVARMLQRCGRSGHQPRAMSRLIGVPTNALELVEFAAARHAMQRGDIESREPIDKPLDVLSQHIVTMAMGDGMAEDQLLRDVRSTWAYRDLTDEEWSWTLEFVTGGGSTLREYPQFHKVVRDGAGHLSVASHVIGRRHRMSIGTITSDAAMKVKFANGRTIGTIEEKFISRLAPGDTFHFAGRSLELLRIRQMTVQVKPAPKRKGVIPRWMGGRSPLSTQLADAVRRKLDEALAGQFDDPEMECARPLLELQQAVSSIPSSAELLIESTSCRGDSYAFVFTFAGRLANEGLSTLAAHRLARARPMTITVNANDWGIALCSPEALALDEADWRDALTPVALVDDLLACLNSSELARRRFREIARVAGLIFSGYPGEAQSNRHLQASSDLFYDVFTRYDASNRLLDQAKREVLDRELNVKRIRATLERIESQRMVIVELSRFSPLSFPLYADRIRESTLSTESWDDRMRRMVAQMEHGTEGEHTQRSMTSRA